MERTGWRDEELSQRHREWGFNCPCVDVDCLMLEYNLGEPIALIEYKHYNAKPVDSEHPSYKALRKLADRGNIPFLIAIYDPEYWGFKVTPGNELARGFFKDDEELTEREYVRKIYALRTVIVEHSTLSKLNNVKPCFANKEANHDNPSI